MTQATPEAQAERDDLLAAMTPDAARRFIRGELHRARIRDKADKDPARYGRDAAFLDAELTRLGKFQHRTFWTTGFAARHGLENAPEQAVSTSLANERQSP